MRTEYKIMRACMSSSHHAFCDYSGHVRAIHVYAHPADTIYDSDHHDDRVYLIDETVYLDWEGADEKLARVLSMIEELG